MIVKVIITFGLLGADVFKGVFPKIATTDLSYQADQTISLMDTIVNIFSSNFVSPMVEANMLQVIVTALILGFGIILLEEGERNTRLVTACNDLNDVFMKCMEMILKLSPIGVFCLLSPVKFFKGMLPAIMFAFSSSSSVGTLPINMECVEKMGASKEVSSFVLPLGATINMDVRWLILPMMHLAVSLFRIWNRRKMRRGRLHVGCNFHAL